MMKFPLLLLMVSAVMLDVMESAVMVVVRSAVQINAVIRE